jgi:Tol biopolymer transport system component
MSSGARAGARFGPYEVVSLLGAGGMGEVYRARDTRLGRDVAVKVLPEQASSDPARLKRFEKEARAASALSHPNIVTIHEVGSVDSTSFIVMELVEGKTLREVLAGGSLPARKLIPIAAQVADGLARAHASGIVHRDLKPENVMVTGDGLVKILDFGLAKLAHPEREAGQPLESETVSQATAPGIAMGTVGYMSPEQACGHPVDFRSDQFSFGSILYEMVTGQRPFQAKTGPETMAAIIREDPRPIASLAPESPPPLRWIVERCLSKEPKERYASTEDLARDLRTLRIHLSEGVTVSGEVSGLRRPFPAWAAGAAAALAVLFAIAGGLFAARSKPSPPLYTQVTFKSGFLSAARFAPDGRTIVYSAAWAGDPLQGFVQRPEVVEPAPFGPPGGAVLAVAPSGEVALALGCKASGHHRLCRGTLAKAPLAGGSPRELYENVVHADWAPEGSALAIVRDVEDRSRLEFPPGRVLYETRGHISYPRLSPSGDEIAFFDHAQPGDDRGSLAVVDLSGKKTVLAPEMETAHGLAWSPSGKEIWFTARWLDEGFIAIQGINLSGKRRLIARAPGILRLHDVFRDGRALVSEDSLEWRIFGLAPGETRERDLTWIRFSMPGFLSRDGRTLLFRESRNFYKSGNLACLRHTDGSPAVELGEGVPLSLSPDGKRVLVRSIADIRSKGNRFVLIPAGAGDPRPISFEGIEEYGSAEFMPDGKEILFLGKHGPERRFYRGPLEGGQARPATPPAAGPFAISSDGRRLLARSNGVSAIFSLDAGPDAPPRPVPGATVADQPVQWSADERSIYLQNSGASVRVFLVDLETGRRTLWKEIIPADPSGATIYGFLLTPDGKSYAYGLKRDLSRLYLVEGLR